MTVVLPAWTDGEGADVVVISAGAADAPSLEFSQASGWLRRDGVEVPLTATEFRLLEYLIEHRGTVFSREQLLSDVWGDQRFITARTVDVHVRRLREQIEKDPAEPAFLLTVRGFGYRFEAAR